VEVVRQKRVAVLVLVWERGAARVQVERVAVLVLVWERAVSAELVPATRLVVAGEERR